MQGGAVEPQLVAQFHLLNEAPSHSLGSIATSLSAPDEEGGDANSGTRYMNFIEALYIMRCDSESGIRRTCKACHDKPCYRAYIDPAHRRTSINKLKCATKEYGVMTLRRDA